MQNLQNIFHSVKLIKFV